MSNLVKQRLFQTVVIWHPTEEQNKQGQTSKVIVEPFVVLGSDDKSVGMKLIKKIPNEFDNQLDQIEVVVRPF